MLSKRGGNKGLNSDRNSSSHVKVAFRMKRKTGCRYVPHHMVLFIDCVLNLIKLHGFVFETAMGSI